jgi:hypothetical protein
MEMPLRAALIDWLRADPALAPINTIVEESPARASPPWLGIAASASTDWSVKEGAGREVRVALELHLRGDDPAAVASLVKNTEDRMASLPKAQEGFEVVSTVFLRSRVEQRPGNTRAALVEYRFRLLAD